MSSADVERILGDLDTVASERDRRQTDPELARAVQAVKQAQQQRFAVTHADLLAHGRWGAAARFFLDDLYGPQDFAERDAQFARVVPAVGRLFPGEVRETVALLAELHALTETLDSSMGAALRNAAAGPALTAEAYVRAWRATGRAQARERQLALVMALGRRLAQHTRSRLLRQALRLMRAPAQAAGLGALQAFLERGFDTFAAMGGADEFLTRVQVREQTLISRLFDANAVALATVQGKDVAQALGQLP